MKFVKKTRGFVLISLLSFLVFVIALCLYLSWVNHEIDARMEQLRSNRQSRFYGQFPPLQKEQLLTVGELKNYLEQAGFREKSAGQDLVIHEFSIEKKEDGLLLGLRRPPYEGNSEALSVRLKLESSSKSGVFRVAKIEKSEGTEELMQLEFPPKRISAFYAGRVRTQDPVVLSDIPVSVRYAVMAIEDIHFLEHSGVSLKSTLRALWKDLKARKFVEGGSTITQQLMKNLYFSREKALSRKIKEAVFAFLTEARHSKEEILEAYLNEIYMGQWSSHEIHGVAEGARFYFGRPITDVTLAQSATLAAIIQLPNSHDPHRHPEQVLKRRNLVLKRMLDGEFILPGEYEDAVKEPIGVLAPEKKLEDIGYFMDLVLRELPPAIQSRLDSDSLSVYTTLNPYLQGLASRELRKNLERLTKGYASIKKKEAKGIPLQSALIAIDVPTCSVLALQGGNSYRQSQFNRVLQGRRQPGSLFKPFVYLSAFASPPADFNMSADAELEGTSFEWKYEGGQTWKPRNYEDEYKDRVTVREALERSLNVPTARLAQKVGLSAIASTLRQAGIDSPLPEVPSLSLGSAEVTPIELARAYVTLANLGKKCQLRPVVKVFDENHNIQYESSLAFDGGLPAEPSFKTVDILKGVLTRGTAASSQSSGLLLDHFAGKTGTTNDYKDAWFVGFSPELLTLVWVGYDEEEKVGLTGAAAALPLWLEFTKGALPFFPDRDFQLQ